MVVLTSMCMCMCACMCVCMHVCACVCECAVCVRVCVCTHLLSCARLFATVAHQAPLSIEFSRQEYWSGLPFSNLVSQHNISENRSEWTTHTHTHTHTHNIHYKKYIFYFSVYFRGRVIGLADELNEGS